MNRVFPQENLRDLPCSICATSCAVGDLDVVRTAAKELKLSFRSDGYLTLEQANKLVRRLLPVKRRRDFKRGERPYLCDLPNDLRAMVCVYGHFIYLDRGSYYSFFNNDVDEVVTYWELKD